jgi:hypothetical protein
MSLDQDGLGEDRPRKRAGLKEPMKINTGKMADKIRTDIVVSEIRETMDDYAAAGYADDENFESYVKSVIQDLENKNYVSASHELYAIGEAIDMEFFKNSWDLISSDFYKASKKLDAIAKKQKKRKYNTEYQTYYASCKQNKSDPISYSAYVKYLRGKSK